MARLDRSTRWPRRRWLAGSAAAVALVTGAATASTSPLSDPTSGRAVFTGVATAHATSLASNPGALSLGPSGAHLYVAATGTLEWMKVERQLLALDTGELSPGPTASGLVASPGATLAVWLARRAFTVGVEVLSPDPAHGTLRAEEALRYHTLGDQLRVTRLGTIGSRRVLGRVYLGGSVSLIRPTLRLRYARDTALEAGRDSVRGLASDRGGAPCGVENPLAAERLALDAQPDALVTYDNAVWTAALQAELAPAWWLAVAYRLIPARTTLRGTGTLTTAPRDGAVDVRGDVLAYLTLPSAIDVELRGPLADPWELHVGGRWEDSSTLDAIDVRLLAADLRATGAPEWTRRARGLRDPLALWAGVEQADLGQRVLVGRAARRALARGRARAHRAGGDRRLGRLARPRPAGAAGRRPGRSARLRRRGVPARRRLGQRVQPGRSARLPRQRDRLRHGGLRQHPGRLRGADRGRRLHPGQPGGPAGDPL